MELSAHALTTFDDALRANPQFKVLQGALRKGKLSNVSADPSVLSKLQPRFNRELPEKVTVLDQGQSGRCWLFAGLNMMRRRMIAHFKLPPEFALSSAHLSRCMKIERCNVAMETMYDLAKRGVTGVEYRYFYPTMKLEGGTFSEFAALVRKYGIVPANVSPDTRHADDPAQMDHIIKTVVLNASSAIVRCKTLVEFRAIKSTVLSDCHRIISACMGSPPRSFMWTPNAANKSEKQYTPSTFYDKVIKPLMDVDKHVCIAHNPVIAFGRTFAIASSGTVLQPDDRDVRRIRSSSRYLNVDMTVFKKAVFKSLTQGRAVNISCDIHHFLLDAEKVLDGEASNIREMFGVELAVSKRDALESRALTKNHAMCIVGCQREANGKFTRWKVENSWGNEYGLNGFITMSDSWFEEHILSAAIQLDCLPVAMQRRYTSDNKNGTMWLQSFDTVFS
jgi:bleomycin hydrolase